MNFSKACKASQADESQQRKRILIFSGASKYINEKFNEDKEKLTTFYNDNGFKDFTIISDSLYTISEDRVGLNDQN